MPNANYAPPRRRVIGPFFIIALIVSVGVFIWQKQQTARRLADVPPPVVEHQVIGGTDLEAAAVPAPSYVQEQAQALGLSAGQLKSLAPVVTAYQEELGPLQQQMGVAVARYGQYQEAQADRQRVKVDDLRLQMAVISDLSGRMAVLRQSYWERTARLLTDNQQSAAKKLWARSLTPNIQTKGPGP
ncbi:hypothetical protein LLH23_03160 [bacterium]|nr:hypothetical protein [bacterium]